MSIALCVLLITAVFSGAAEKTMKETDTALLTTTVAQLIEECGCGTNATQIELTAGEEDAFGPDSDPPASPSPTLQALFGPGEVGFDYPGANEKFIHTFEWEDCGNITGACLEVRLRSLGDVFTNDRFSLLFSGANYSISYKIWENTTPSVQTETILLDLSGLPAADTLITATTSGSVDLLPMLNNNDYLDLYIQDDTSVDYANLILCCEQPCQPTDCGIIEEVATNPANWTEGWTGTNIIPETTITFQECGGEVYTLYGDPGLEAANNENNENITLHNYGDCQCAMYCWIEVDGKKIIQSWEALPSDECCDQCCKYCCEIDFTFIGSPIGGGGGSGGPPSLCPGQILTYEYHLTNDGSYDVECYFSDPSPAGNVYYPSPFPVGYGETETIYIHYQMPGNFEDICAQPSYIFSHVLNVTIIDTDQGDVVCAPIKTSVHIDCHKCPEITCCDGISGLFSGGNMQMKDDNGDWIPIKIIQWNSNMDFGNLDDQLHYNCGAEWVYGIHDWDNPSSNHEHYKLDFTIPNGECYEIAFTACVDDAAIFKLETPDGVTEFFDTTELLTPSGTYSNFYACFESGDNGEMEYCLPPGDYTLHIEHWNTEGSSYGLIFAATKCNLCDCQYGPCVDITKKGVDPETGQWVDNIDVPFGTEVVFLITVCNCGTSDLHGIKVVDEFPDCLKYVGSTHPVSSISGNQVVWEFGSLILHPGDCYEIEVKAEVVSQENCVKVHANSQGGSVADEDCATVTGALLGSGPPEQGLTESGPPEQGLTESGGSCLGTILVIFLLCGGLFAVHRKKA
jgi:hypothetical protein